MRRKTQRVSICEHRCAGTPQEPGVPGGGHWNITDDVPGSSARVRRQQDPREERLLGETELKGARRAWHWDSAAGHRAGSSLSDLTPHSKTGLGPSFLTKRVYEPSPWIPDSVLLLFFLNSFLTKKKEGSNKPESTLSAPIVLLLKIKSNGTTREAHTWNTPRDQPSPPSGSVGTFNRKCVCCWVTWASADTPREQRVPESPAPRSHTPSPSQHPGATAHISSPRPNCDGRNNRAGEKAPCSVIKPNTYATELKVDLGLVLRANSWARPRWPSPAPGL